MDQSAYSKLLLWCALLCAGASIIFAFYERQSTKLEQWPEQVRPFSGIPQDLPGDVSAGEYLARAADCVACHTAPGGKFLSGGRAFRLPFGEVYSTNITSDRDVGIGGWTDDQFVDAVRRGIGSRGHLFPVMPYTSYTGMSKQDVLEIKKYLMTVEPVGAETPPNNLAFPFDQRWGVRLWSMAFFQDRRFEGVQGQSYDWNRGAYLARALGRCGECRATRNAGFAMSSQAYFSGVPIEARGTYNTAQKNLHGVGAWTSAQIANHLSTGYEANHSFATGRIPDVVEQSFQYLTPRDMKALVMYLKASLPVNSGTSGLVELQSSALDAPNALMPPRK
ncbi:hypothetical protein ALO95_200238 [Pseudomonas syringae pv. antirrhini]|uniref:Gluconate 2-dehydrogenase n=2 Tax=Pseudomonas TaxID=286 RepID=A0A0P9JXE5_9PSED|nr:Gluconate 2-dehydrogenase [Pseudomonas syringae pv. antirrhini]RMP32147.1 Gluconate 2-dehydrogenase [Pseudomonas syringae pv. antirrhini]RMP42494.1 hypothetical protein ALQ23_200260 [Pseudomonas syringae pv. antirrhini]RMW23471.1 hypothetical protein ALO95_200238 [Pseudomonas syringae pv. antirrhini]